MSAKKTSNQGIKLSITQRPGFATPETMRKVFEGIMTQTPALKKRTKLKPLLKKGEFSGYADPQTDALWVGYAIGLRTAEKLDHKGFFVCEDVLSRIEMTAGVGNRLGIGK